MRGLPIVATDSGGTEEVVGREGVALLHRAGDVEGLANSCLALLGDGALSARMAAAGRDRALAFSPEALARRHLALLA